MQGTKARASGTAATAGTRRLTWAIGSSAIHTETRSGEETLALEIVV